MALTPTPQTKFMAFDIYVLGRQKYRSLPKLDWSNSSLLYSFILLQKFPEDEEDVLVEFNCGVHHHIACYLVFIRFDIKIG